jgi:hypothetical protein
MADLPLAQRQNIQWLFELVFDYGDHDALAPKPADDLLRDAAGAPKHPWPHRADAFSSYRPGFELRTTRLCRRALMFHHFEGEEGVGQDCLVRSTDFSYSAEEDAAGAGNPIYSFLRSVAQTGYRRSGAGYQRRGMPPVEFEYSRPVIQDAVHDVDAESLENLPVGVDGTSYEWTDLHGEGIPGILTEQAKAGSTSATSVPSASRQSSSRRSSALPPSRMSAWRAGRRGSWTWPATANPTGGARPRHPRPLRT